MWLRSIFVFAASVLLSACGANQELARGMQDLRLQVIELKGSVENLHVQLEELDNRVLLLKDRVERVELSSGRGGALPALPVVRLGADRAPAPEPEPEPEPAPSGPSRWTGTSGTVSTWEPEEPPLGRDEGLPAMPRRGEASPAAEASKPAPAPVPALASAAPAARRGGDDPMTLYKDGYKAVMAGAHEEGRQTLFTFLLRHADHDLADNALYWIGESYYGEKDFANAIRYFQRIIDEHPGGNKVPDAMVKAALSLQRLGEGGQGRFLLEQVIRVFPGSQAAGVARQKLIEWDGGGSTP